MRAIAVVAKRLVAVVAKCAETFREAVPFQPMEKIPAATQLLSLPVAAAVDVVNAEELITRLAATRAHFAIVLDSCGFQTLMPFTSVGVALCLVQVVVPLQVSSALVPPLRVVLVPPVIVSRIFPVALRVFPSALALVFGVIEHWRLMAANLGVYDRGQRP